MPDVPVVREAELAAFRLDLGLVQSLLPKITRRDLGADRAYGRVVDDAVVPNERVGAAVDGARKLTPCRRLKTDSEDVGAAPLGGLTRKLTDALAVLSWGSVDRSGGVAARAGRTFVTL